MNGKNLRSSSLPPHKYYMHHADNEEFDHRGWPLESKDIHSQNCLTQNGGPTGEIDQKLSLLN